MVSNAAGLEEMLERLDVQPDPAQLALGRTMAAAIDEGAGASMVQQYREWLAIIGALVPDDPDELDGF